MADSKTISKRDGKGRFAQGHSGNPAGRPVGAETRALRELREWTANKGLPLLIKKAEAGELDALKTLVTLGIPKYKPAAPPLEGLEGCPVPADRTSFPNVALFVFNAIKSGRLSLDDGQKFLEFAHDICNRNDRAKTIEEMFSFNSL